MTYKELFERLQDDVIIKSAIFVPLEKQIALKGGFHDEKELLAFLRIRSEWLGAKKHYFAFEEFLDSKKVKPSDTIDLKLSYQFFSI